MSPQPGTAAGGGGRAHQHGGVADRVHGSGWHGPHPRPSGAGTRVVGTPQTTAYGGGDRDGYAFGVPTHALRARVPRIWGRGIPGTRANARVATRQTCAEVP